jgi:hypothetical protein
VQRRSQTWGGICRLIKKIFLIKLGFLNFKQSKVQDRTQLIQFAMCKSKNLRSI